MVFKFVPSVMWRLDISVNYSCLFFINMLGVSVCVHVVAIMFCLCKGLNGGRDLLFGKVGNRDIIIFCIGFFLR